MKTKPVIIAAAVCLIAGAIVGFFFAPFRARPTGPAPSLSPQQVVQIQLEALRTNGADDAGIARVFSFASPGNRSQTGPLERFAVMLRQGPFRVMFDYVSDEYAPIDIRGRVALQVVTLFDVDHVGHTFMFQLSRQTAAPYTDCWMTDAVIPAPPAPAAPPPAEQGRPIPGV